MNITALTVNFKTPDLIVECVNSFMEHYPTILHIVIDNGGCAESAQVLRDLPVVPVFNEYNIGHGRALDQGLGIITTRYAFLLDSDTITQRGGFLEKMLELFDLDHRLFAAGWLRKVNDSGVAYSNKTDNGIDYIHPFACLLDVEKYRLLRPFWTTGAPAINTMRDAAVKGFTVADFPIRDYIYHKVAGTRGLFRGRWLPDTKEKPGEWNRYNL